MSTTAKRDLGQFFTRDVVWMRPHIKRHLSTLRQRYSVCVDPFAGDGHLLRAASQFGFAPVGHDVDPSMCGSNGWGAANDSIRNVPVHDRAFVLTNPPYLAKNSAKRLGSTTVDYFQQEPTSLVDPSRAGVLDDLFKIAIERTIAHYDDSVWIVPESVIQDLNRLPHWRQRLHSVTILEENPFIDTEHPVCVLIFTTSNPEGLVWKNDACLGLYEDLWAIHQQTLSSPGDALHVRFNAPDGTMGYRAVDGTKSDGSMRIGFCLGSELGYDRRKIKVSSRHMTYIETPLSPSDLERVVLEANRQIENYRSATADVFLTAFMGNTKSGVRRRRLDYKLARKFLNSSYLAVKNPENHTH